ncbi:cilia- and flagella-associated protein 74-like isoform X2 [Ptychodera flava]|uniref:cilia- and flagella-associated protein 74-like isoform X2 n=1 Tax=Ptychodera flava TaxID=63121 RepID=UPI00396A4765
MEDSSDLQSPDVPDDFQPSRYFMESEETPLEYESDPELWSYSDETSMTGPDENDYPLTSQQKITRQEKLRMMALRRHLDQLSEKVLDTEYLVTKTREELKTCRDKVEALEKERDEVYNSIQEEEEANNMAAVYRLRSKHEKLCIELEAEEAMEKEIAQKLEQAEFELAKVQVEQGKFLLVEEDLQKDEEKWQKERTDIAAQRAKKETLKVLQAERRKKNRDKDHIAALRERDRKHRQAIVAARRSREAASKYLKETLAKVRREEAEEEERNRFEMEQRMQTILSLKQNIGANRENLRAIQARDRYLARQAAEAEDNERHELLESGENPDEILLRRKRLRNFEIDQQEFDEDQRDKQVDIVSRILKEEKQMKKRMQQYPQLWPESKRDRERAKRLGRPRRKARIGIIHETSGSSSMEYCADVEEAAPVHKPSSKLTTVSSDDDDDFSPYGVTSRDEKGSDSEDRDETLAKPEFKGLWDQRHKAYKVPKDEEQKFNLTHYQSKMERAIMTEALEKHRSGVVKKQVAAGKEFKGCPFYSKPDVIHFKDFDVGKTYKKKVILTNVSYSVNFLKLIDISEHLKNFVNVYFDPPGQMSAGLTCEMLVTFKPMINEDLQGEVSFLAQTGPFSIPLICSTKKCDLSVDKDLIDFSTQVIGETLKKSIMLTNKGALGTKFEFVKTTGMRPTTMTSAMASIGGMTGVDTEKSASTIAKEEVDKEDAPKEGDGVSEKDEKTPEPSEHGAPTTIQEEGGTVSGAPQPENEAADDEGKQEPEEKEKDETAGSEKGLEEKPSSAKSGKSEVQTQITDGEDRDDVSTGSVSLGPDDLEDISNLDGMKVGTVAIGYIAPFSSVKLEVIFAPTIPGKVETDFEIRFSDPLSENISVKATALAIDVPVWVERQNVDLKICMFDRLYQDSIVVNNRATTALRLRFEVCKELRNHLELLPKTGYIQAQSQFSAQMKFLPRHSLIEEGGRYFDKETGVLEAPMTIRVADQTAPVPFIVHAVVTTSDLEFDTEFIDFGFCSIYESVVTTVKLTNKSILSQSFGFVNLPDYVDVQPNDGFGTLLPIETLELDIIFNAKKAKEYNFELTCKSGINRDFKIQCKAVGVHPPLELSNTVIHFAATALCDTSFASFYVVNSHTSANEFTHPVPRIGKGEIAPVGPTSFEFVVPEDTPLTITPRVATVMPGKKCCVSVKFTPILTDRAVVDEAVRMITRNLEAKARKEFEDAQLAAIRSAEAAAEKGKKGGGGKKGGPGATSKSPGKTPGGKSLQSPSSMSGPRPVTPPNPEDIDPVSDDFAAARGSLLRNYRGNFSSYSIPCFVASGSPGDPGTLPYSVHNTLYLEVHCPTVKPSVVVISNHGRTTTDFGEVSIGQNIIKSITIQNISDQQLDLKSSMLDTVGPFVLLNALRPLQPDATHTLLISFTPKQGKVFYEVLEIRCPTSTLPITLQGQGVSPKVSLSVQDGLLDMGYVLAGEENVETFKIENTSSLSVSYAIKMDSLSLTKHVDQQGLPLFIKRDEKMKSLVGTANFNGRSVFDCTPVEGVIAPGGNQEITVTFAPDHSSDYFSDGARLSLFGQDESHVIHLIGKSREHTMYVLGGDEITPCVESLAAGPLPEEEEGEAKPQAVPVLLTFRSVGKEEGHQPATRSIEIGCIRTMAVSQKKNGEFIFDNINAITAKGFQIDNQKGMVEAGATKTVNFTWVPQPGHDPNATVEASIVLNMKGDIAERFNVLLRAMVVSE